MRPRLLVFPGSNRAGSYNVRLAGAIVKALSTLECDVTRISLADYPLPLFDADLEKRDGVPENAVRLARLFHEHDGVVAVSPEYNTSLAPLMKNTLDWVSRVPSDQYGKLMPYKGKVFAIASTSPGGYGGIRGLNHLRAILVNMGALIISEQVAVANAEKAFGDDDMPVDTRTATHLRAMAKSLVETAGLLTRLPGRRQE